ncbi:DUF4209 domain-containing protein [Lonsdalea populi]|uniref:DUF4209 domain-containing protein n=1 Tax=Lonsdalea populi TaxID=1172565 RepID=UPI000A1D823F|nr:DUF4209 domain-containing protein [Lonsdalea populi]OSN01292.1 hypothetical protein AU499_07200 [Lonsdalea populi]QPQ24978.1 DUF4209 domain-containing protein [Lonsdalea populi]RAT43949.1 hypothetical protein AU494_08020 [Lonsdalea populi]RAT45104.1 hypothetical protein AU495_06255 [Lonsdalea populi]RAT57526.1 hypothetical protein AU500_05835 [Lonsdalea populi]
MNNDVETEILEDVANVDTAIQEDDDSYYAMYVFFSDRKKQYTDRGETELANKMHTLADITLMALDAESKNEPIVAAVIFRNGSSNTPENLQLQQRAFLDKLFPHIKTGLLKSRIAEISLFLDKPLRWELVDEIIAGYLLEPLSEKRWHTLQQSLWTRALSLARQYRKEDPVTQIEAQISLYLDEHKPGGTDISTDISLHLFQFIHEHHLLSANLGKNADHLMALGAHKKAEHHYYLAERIYCLACKFYKLDRNCQESQAALFESAECLFLEAENRAQVKDQGNIIASGMYEKALQRYRLIPTAQRAHLGADIRIDECRKRIRVHGELSLDDMHMFKLPPCDLTELTDIAVNHVRGKGDIIKACQFFAGFGTISVESVRENDAHKQSLISDLFGEVYLSGDGRMIGRSRANATDRAHHRELLSFDFSLKIVVVGQILPAMDQLMQEYNFPTRFFLELCYCSPLIPEDRIELTARGLYLGFEYRFSESIHLLSPQVEYLVRNLLKKAGVKTSTVDESGIENEIGLGSLLDKPEAKTLFGDDMHFNLKALFTDPIGANIRNYVAHGLLNDYSSQSEAVVYAWWLYFKIILSSVTSAP